MDLKSLSDADKATVGEALRAAADGPFFPDWEFHSLFGLKRGKVRAIANGWPELDTPHEEATMAVVNSLNNPFGYRSILYCHRFCLDDRLTGSYSESEVPASAMLDTPGVRQIDSC